VLAPSPYGEESSGATRNHPEGGGSRKGGEESFREKKRLQRKGGVKASRSPLQKLAPGDDVNRRQKKNSNRRYKKRSGREKNLGGPGKREDL